MKKRIEVIDWLRGIVLVLMALDHSRVFFLKVEALDVTNSGALLFLTRLVSNYCAPTFVFLAGISASLVESKLTKVEASRKLFLRGFWLIFLELTIVRFSFGYFNPHYIVFQVIFVMGVSMILLSGLIYLKRWMMVSVCLLMLSLHNLLDYVDITNFGCFVQGLFKILHQHGTIEYLSGWRVNVWYPIIPWPGVMLLGYLMGNFYRTGYDGKKRQRIFMAMGVLFLILFVVLRTFNIYGDSQKWISFDYLPQTILSFINCVKYPPSLLFLLMTLSLPIFLLGLLDNISFKPRNLFVFFGKCSFVFYVVHLFLLSSLKRFFGGLVSTDNSVNAVFKVYLIWLILVVVMFLFCLWHRRLRPLYCNKLNKTWLIRKKHTKVLMETKSLTNK